MTSTRSRSPSRIPTTAKQAKVAEEIAASSEIADVDEADHVGDCVTDSAGVDPSTSATRAHDSNIHAQTKPSQKPTHDWWAEVKFLLGVGAIAVAVALLFRILHPAAAAPAPASCFAGGTPLAERLAKISTTPKLQKSLYSLFFSASRRSPFSALVSFVDEQDVKRMVSGLEVSACASLFRSNARAATGETVLPQRGRHARRGIVAARACATAARVLRELDCH